MPVLLKSEIKTKNRKAHKNNNSSVSPAHAWHGGLKSPRPIFRNLIQLSDFLTRRDERR